MIIYLLLLGFVSCVAAAWLLCAASFVVAKVLKTPETARQIGKVWKWLSAVAALVGVFVWLVFSPPASLSYRREFGEGPTVDVQHLRGSASTGHDGWDTFLRFQAAPSTIRRLAQSKNMLAVAPGESKDHELIGLAPDWWRPNVASH